MVKHPAELSQEWKVGASESRKVQDFLAVREKKNERKRERVNSLCSINVSGVGSCAASWFTCVWLVNIPAEGLLPFEWEQGGFVIAGAA